MSESHQARAYELGSLPGWAIVFWALTAVNAMPGAVIFYFLVEGLGDGSVSADNAALWLMLVALPVATIGGGLR
jgi:hypothetical protein